MYHFFIGIDISKDNFVVAKHGEKKSLNYLNNEKGFLQFCEDFKQQLPLSLIILETTGGYEIELISYLQAKKLLVHRANTRKVKSFIRSFGTLAKTDSIDAFGLALYGCERHSKLEIYQESPYKNLLKLVQRRNDLKIMLVQEKNRLKAPDQEAFKTSFNTIIEVIQQEMQRIEIMIAQLRKEHPQLEEIAQVLKTIKGIGDITATQLIALLPELGTLDRKKIASLAGLAPHPNESGKKIGYRATRGGRADVKPVLFLSAMTAARSKSELGDFYKKLVKAGKKKMVALTALMRKILVIANAKVRDYLASLASLQHG
jgi:transposase